MMEWYQQWHNITAFSCARECLLSHNYRILPTGGQNSLIAPPLNMLLYMWGSASFGEVIPTYVSHDTVNYECFTSGLNILGNLTSCDCYRSVQFSANPHPHWEALKQPKSLLLKNEWGFSHHYRVFPSILIPCCHFLLAVKLHFKTRWTRKESGIIYCVSILHYR